jgi:hypothetical protein
MTNDLGMMIEDVKIAVLQEEISILKGRLEPQATGHLHTTISVLENRINEMKETIKHGKKI